LQGNLIISETLEYDKWITHHETHGKGLKTYGKGFAVRFFAPVHDKGHSATGA
jgi:hypothetical protein